MKKKLAIAGAGFAGAVIARELAETGLYEVHVFDERDHVAGNCHTSRDESSGVMLHRYGPHIFNTSRDDVWSYINKWGTMIPYTNRVKAVTAKGIYSLPINLLTINQFFGKRFNPREAEAFIASLGDKSIGSPANLEEQALKFLGRDLYENFFRGYTQKQWGVSPSNLPASILQRLPVRFSYDDNYYSQKYQGIPMEGYTRIVCRLLDHPHIHVQLRTPFPSGSSSRFFHVFWTGPLDAWFNFRFGRLKYRTLKFEQFQEKGDYQGNAVINYCEESVTYTRITEHKHFAPQEMHDGTTCFREFSSLAGEGDIPYYPLRLAHDKEVLARYTALANECRGVTFAGRLATYRYLDMHVVIGESLDLSGRICRIGPHPEAWPRFSTPPLPPASTLPDPGAQKRLA
jgi:UDP-galactopyranose mutase